MEVTEIHQSLLWIRAHLKVLGYTFQISKLYKIRHQLGPTVLLNSWGKGGGSTLAQLPIWQEETPRHPPPPVAATHSHSHTQLTRLSNCLLWIPIPGTLNLDSVLL